MACSKVGGASFGTAIISGQYNTAIGVNTVAMGYYSHAEGVSYMGTVLKEYAFNGITLNDYGQHPHMRRMEHRLFEKKVFRGRIQIASNMTQFELMDVDTNSLITRLRYSDMTELLRYWSVIDRRMLIEKKKAFKF